MHHRKKRTCLQCLKFHLKCVNVAFHLRSQICINPMLLHLSLMGIHLFHRSIQFLHLGRTLRNRSLKQGKTGSFFRKKISNNGDVFRKRLLSIWIRSVVLKVCQKPTNFVVLKRISLLTRCLHASIMYDMMEQLL